MIYMKQKLKDQTNPVITGEFSSSFSIIYRVNKGKISKD